MSHFHRLLIFAAYKTDFWIRIRSQLVSGTMTVAGDQWPLFMYADQEFDPEEPWNGLFRNQLLIWVSVVITSSIVGDTNFFAFLHL